MHQLNAFITYVKIFIISILFDVKYLYIYLYINVIITKLFISPFEYFLFNYIFL